MELGCAPPVAVRLGQRPFEARRDEKSRAGRAGGREGRRARRRSGARQWWRVRSCCAWVSPRSFTHLVRDGSRRPRRIYRRHVGNRSGNAQGRRPNFDNLGQDGCTRDFGRHHAGRHSGRGRRSAVHRRCSGASQLAGSVRRRGTGWSGWGSGRFTPGSNTPVAALVRAMRDGNRAARTHVRHADAACGRPGGIRQRCGQRRLLHCRRLGSFTSVLSVQALARY